MPEKEPDFDNPSREKLAWMYTTMVRIREFDDFVEESLTKYPGMIRGHTHLSQGQEGVTVGSIAAIELRDYISSTYRCHGQTIAKGTPMDLILAEIWGKKDGLCKGKGGSMHLCDMKRNVLPACGTVAQGIPHATGAALGCQVRRTGQIVLCFFGDGATKEGVFYESLALASLWKLPIVYIMENNLYQASTRIEQDDPNAAAGENLSVKARAFSMPSKTIDGMDALLVYRTVLGAVKRAREGNGPTFIEAICYRYSAHGNTIVPRGMLPTFPKHESEEMNPQELEDWRKKDPITNFALFLEEKGILSKKEASNIHEAALKEIENARNFALTSPLPEPEQATTDVYSNVQEAVR